MKGTSLAPWGDKMKPLLRYLISWSTRIGVLVILTLILLACVVIRDLKGYNLSSYESLKHPKQILSDGMKGLGDEAQLCVSEKSETRRVKLVVPGCPSTPPGLLGRLEVEQEVTEEQAEARVGGVGQGGFWWPVQCEARWRVAVIVPYRDRAHQIGAFLNHMHPFLQRQQLNYSIYIVEQDGKDLFNRARLLNVGFLAARREGPWDCYAFHDIDMLPLNDYHLYHCSPQPRHLAVAPSSHKYKSAHYTPYKQYFGGACLMTEGHLRRVNGWSNTYWGWGGEDDDMWRRMKLTDMSVWRYPTQYATYKMLSHKPQVVNPKRYQMLQRNTGRFPYDGLNNLNYTIIRKTRKALYTHLLANVGFSVTQATDEVGSLLSPPPKNT